MLNDSGPASVREGGLRPKQAIAPDPVVPRSLNSQPLYHKNAEQSRVSTKLTDRQNPTAEIAQERDISRRQDATVELVHAAIGWVEDVGED